MLKDIKRYTPTCIGKDITFKAQSLGTYVLYSDVSHLPITHLPKYSFTLMNTQYGINVVPVADSKGKYILHYDLLSCV